MMTIIRKGQLIAIMIVIVVLVVGYLKFVKQKEEILPVIDEISDPLLSEKLSDAVLIEDTAEAINNIDESNLVVSAEPVENNNIDNFFAETRLEKDRLRDQEVFMQEMVLNSINVSDDVYQKAQNELAEIGKRSEKELLVESLIKAKGFKEAVVFINDDNINVIVFNNATELSKMQVAQIKEAVINEIGNDIGDLKIVVK